MAITRWEPARELQSIQRDFNRLFGSFFDTPTTRGNVRSLRRWVPAVDLVEDGDHYVLRADLPGLSEKDVDVEVQDSVLTISGERKSEHEQRGEGFRRVERASGRFVRSLRLPEGVEPEDVKASFDKGVLEVSIPKPEQSKPRRVPISVSGSTPAVEGEPAQGEPEQAAA
jgi:HSP20 family protein